MSLIIAEFAAAHLEKLHCNIKTKQKSTDTFHVYSARAFPFSNSCIFSSAPLRWVFLSAYYHLLCQLGLLSAARNAPALFPLVTATQKGYKSEFAETPSFCRDKVASLEALESRFHGRHVELMSCVLQLNQNPSLFTRQGFCKKKKKNVAPMACDNVESLLKTTIPYLKPLRCTAY